MTHRRGGAGSKQNGLPRQLAGVPMATRALKVCISLAGDRSPQRHRGCREAESGSPPAGWFYKAFSFSPIFLFHARKRKMGCGRLTGANGPRGHTPHTNAIPDRVILPCRAIGEPPARVPPLTPSCASLAQGAFRALRRAARAPPLDPARFFVKKRGKKLLNASLYPAQTPRPWGE